MGTIHTSQSTELCVEAISQWEGPGHTAPDHTPAILLGSLRGIPGHLHPSSLNLGQCGDKTGQEPASAATRAPTADTANGPEDREASPLLSPVPEPDDTHKHTHAHTPNARVQG